LLSFHRNYGFVLYRFRYIARHWSKIAKFIPEEGKGGEERGEKKRGEKGKKAKGSRGKRIGAVEGRKEEGRKGR